MNDYKLTPAQMQFLELVRTGESTTKAGIAVGYSKAIASHWARVNPTFAVRYKALMEARQSAKLPLLNAVPSQSVKLHQLAMQRLEREIREDGPHAVLASAAIVLTTSQGAPIETPAVEADEVPAIEATQTLLHLVTTEQAPSARLREMLLTVFSPDEPRAGLADTMIARQCIERYYKCNLEVLLSTNSKGIANMLKNHLSQLFEVAIEPHASSHSARVYYVPQPAICA